MKPRGQLATILLLLALPFVLATTLQIERTMRVLVDGLNESGNLLINQIYEQMRDALSLAKGNPTDALRHDARLAAFLSSTQAFGRGVVYARITAPDGAVIAGLAQSEAGTTDHAPPFARLAALAHSDWPPDLIAAFRYSRTYEMSRTVMMNGEAFAVIQIGLSTAFIATEAQHDAVYGLKVGAAAIALCLFGAIFVTGRLRKSAPVTGRSANPRDDASAPEGGRGDMTALAERFDQLSKRIRLSRSPSRLGRGRLFEILRSISDGVLLLDSAGAILFANSEAQGRLGLPAGGLAEGKPLDTFIGHDNPLARVIETARSTGTEVRDVAVEPGGGSSSRLLVSVFALGHGLEPPGMLVMMRDLESIRELETAIGHSEQLIQIGGVIAGVGGRIRDPLSTIAAQLEQIRQEAGRGLPVDRKLAVVRGEIDRLERAVDALLSFIRPERLELAPVQINVLLAEAARPVVRRGIRLEYRLDNAVGEVMADRALIAEAFHNVIANAVEAAPDGGQLTIATALQSGGFAEIVITDTGPGIAPDNLKRVFNLFFTTKKRRNGVGLSLALRAVELHHGTIDVKSTVGAGTAVRIRLPLANRRAPVIALRSA
ncbi:MAG TPA: ATP-binding protein [Candidatus Binataceae bacterium]|nr:ATP-binding protein [Candidatus Binataceae bacterium]